MENTTHILCVCENGNNRSVGTRRRLYRRGYRDVIATGVRSTTPETLRFLVDWAEVILVAEPWMAAELPPSDKVNPSFTIGPDVFGRSDHRQLQDIVKEQLTAIGLR